MAIQINWKICDNDKACGGIAVCPTGALFWNEAESTIGIINELCTSCRLCVIEGCPVGAIIVTETPEEFEHIKEEIIKDPHNKEQLFVDRFGAAPISDDVLIGNDETSKPLSQGVVIIEHFVDSSIQCLLKSIKVDDVRYKTGIPFSYFKCRESAPQENTTYPIVKLYRNGRRLGSIEGYYSEDQFDDFVRRIMEILQ